MSETVHYRGTLKQAIKLEGENLEEQCKRILKVKALKAYADSYEEMLLDKFYKEYVVRDNILYIVDKREIDTDEDIFSMHEDENGVLNFEVKYYNGGCSFDEAIEEAFENKS